MLYDYLDVVDSMEELCNTKLSKKKKEKKKKYRAKDCPTYPWGGYAHGDHDYALLERLHDVTRDLDIVGHVRRVQVLSTF